MSDVSKQDLLDLEKRLGDAGREMEARLEARIAANTEQLEARIAANTEQLEARIAANTERLEARMAANKEAIVEAMRDMQTELLRGFEVFTGAQTIRLRKLEADQSNLDSALSGRVLILENRLHQIEMRLGGM